VGLGANIALKDCSKNLKIKKTAFEGLIGSEKHVTENWKTGSPCYVAAVCYLETKGP
jgi:hypothetical protein